MLSDDLEDVFDSVTWESPADTPYPTVNATIPPRPGFKQSIEEGEESRGPHDPKWYGYLITHVKDPVKELAETKDAYVSYLVTAKVSFAPVSSTPLHSNILRRTCLSSQPPIHPPGDAFKTLSFSEIILLRTFPHV
jgi:hypothetical protein